jgi:large subunit ribosomal protein L24e
VARTLEAMSRVSEIRSKRERQFYRERMKGNKERGLEADRKLVAENQHLLPPEYRDQVAETLATEVEPVEKMEVEAEEQTLEELQKQAVEQKVAASKTKAKRKQKVVRGKGVEAMDVDE